MQAVLVPEWSRRTSNRNCRIFQHQTVPDILKTVLAGTSVQFRLNRSYPIRNYCVQFLESDFHFASRLLEAEGIYCAFEHPEKDHVLVIADNSVTSAEVEAPSSVIFDREPAAAIKQGRVTSWKKTQSLSRGKHTARDYCFESPDSRVEATAVVLDR